MNYFKYFPKTTESIDNTDVSIIDISIRYKLLDYIKTNKDMIIQTGYVVEEEIRPEQVSYELYGSYEYTWILLCLNNVYNIYEDWVQPQSVIDKLLIRKYGSLENSQKKILAWYDRYGYEVSENSKFKVKSVTAYEKILRDNQSKRNIQIFNDVSIQKIQNDFRNTIKIL